MTDTQAPVELSEEEKLKKLYGRLPQKKKAPLNKSLLNKERKYFDSGDYAMSKAGKTPDSHIGTTIPSPENIPHVSPPSLNGGIPLNGTSPTNGLMGASPVKESGLAKETAMAEEPSA